MYGNRFVCDFVVNIMIKKSIESRVLIFVDMKSIDIDILIMNLCK